MNTTIFYFTGTGNSLKVSKDLAQYLENVKLVQIRQERLSQPLVTDAEVIGFILPTIFSGIPKLVGQFIQHLEIVGSSPYIFVVSTHGDRQGAGIVSEQIARLLAAKELALAACFAVQMPHNVPARDHLTTAQEKSRLFADEARQIPQIAESIRKFQRIPPKNKKLKSFFERLTYNGGYNSAKTSLDKGFYVEERCVSCSNCSKICPAHNIEMVNGKPKWKSENCQFCFACLQWCPQRAIQYKKGTIGVERYHHPEIKASELFYTE
ncbi:EFR1 family ferrodoxin [Desulfosporosinus sp. PR]|uniref:EFR1 family ferrodoxin n=1 Tax=Candidatus Desulfosporosinus nitrosoreducens TaxID=3401928 RepID=UPI0027F8910B|nr:EFR1 family ferrodoxin [Desulfosporosinus sp. PR]MDQ7097070.1 EFR1 family ferrodoxin [Desulfosporosinus sp. PR]